MIAVQHVVIRWSKDERGPQQGAIRNALPRAFPFAPPPGEGAGWLHLVVMDAAEGYRPTSTWRELPLQPDLDGIEVIAKGDFAEIRVRPVGDLYLQKPSRPHFDGLIARLSFGKRIEIRVNTAYDHQDQRRYADHGLQVAYGDRARLDLPLHRTIDERAPLY